MRRYNGRAVVSNAVSFPLVGRIAQDAPDAFGINAEIESVPYLAGDGVGGGACKNLLENKLNNRAVFFHNNQLLIDNLIAVRVLAGTFFPAPFLTLIDVLDAVTGLIGFILSDGKFQVKH